MKHGKIIGKSMAFNAKITWLTILYILFFNAAMTEASDGMSMIRQDRVWECTSYDHIQYGIGDGWIKYMKFDGTEEIGGKTYHRLITFKRIYPIFNQDTQTWSYDRVWDNLYENEGYLREENGVCYTLVACNEMPSAPCESSFLNGIHFREGIENPYEHIVELPIYDFNIPEGDVFMGLTFLGPGIGSGTAMIVPLKVFSKSYVEIAGEICCKVEVGYWGFPEYSFIEGIGASNHGCVNYHEFFDQPTCMWGHNEMNRVFDYNGNLIYQSDEKLYEDLKFDGISLVSTLETERTTEARLYDIMGREISVPAPGQVYIKGGKKYVAPLR